MGNGIVKVVKSENEGYNVSLEVKYVEDVCKLIKGTRFKYDMNMIEIMS